MNVTAREMNEVNPIGNVVAYDIDDEAFQECLWSLRDSVARLARASGTGGRTADGKEAIFAAQRQLGVAIYGCRLQVAGSALSPYMDGLDQACRVQPRLVGYILGAIAVSNVEAMDDS